MTAVAASNNSEELILELFDVLERCPAAARDAATDAALEAIAKAGAPEEPEEPVPEAIKSEPSFMQPKSAYDRYRDAQRDRLARQHPELEPMQLNEKMRLTWAELGEAARAPYVQQAHAERDAWQEAQGVQPEPWDADRPRKPPSVFDLWSRATKPREVIGAQKSEAQVRKQISELYKALTPEQRAPYQAEYDRTMPKFLEDEKAWAAKWNLVKTCKGFVPSTHPAAINKAKRLSGDVSTSGDTPPLPTSYPKALDMWSRDLKETYRTKFPSLNPPDLLKKMKADWAAMTDEDPVKADYKRRSAKLKEEYASRYSEWQEKQIEEGPRKKRRAAVNADLSGDSRVTEEGSGLANAAHFSDAQKAVLESQRALWEREPTHEDALDLSSRAHEALARRFASEISEEPPTDLLKHYYSMIANWLKRRS